MQIARAWARIFLSTDKNQCTHFKALLFVDRKGRYTRRYTEHVSI